MQQVVADQRQHGIELEITGLPGHGDGGVISEKLHAGHGDRFRHDRVDLAWHAAAAGLQCWQVNLGQSVQGAAAHPAQIIGDFQQGDRNNPQLPAQFNGGILARKRSKEIDRRPKRDAGTAFQDRGEALREQRVRIQACSYGGASLRDSLQLRQYPAQTVHGLLQLGAPATKFLTERDRHCIH